MEADARSSAGEASIPAAPVSSSPPASFNISGVRCKLMRSRSTPDVADPDSAPATDANAACAAAESTGAESGTSERQVAKAQASAGPSSSSSSTPTQLPVGPRLPSQLSSVRPGPLAPRATHSHRGARILSEESYTHALSALIQRDFFPDLARLRAENEYLDALDAAAAATNAAAAGAGPGAAAGQAPGVPVADALEAEARAEQRVRRAARRLVRLEEGLGIIPPTPRRRADGAHKGSGKGKGKGKGKARADDSALDPGSSHEPGGGLGLAGTPLARAKARTPRWDDATPGATPYAGSGAGGAWDATPVRAGGRGRGGWPGASGAASAYGEFDDEDDGAALLYSSSDDEDALGGEGMRALSGAELAAHSLSSFERAYTSADNASFGSLLAKANAERRARYGWAFDEERKARHKWELARGRERTQADEGAQAAREAAAGHKAIAADKERLLLEAGSTSSHDTTQGVSSAPSTSTSSTQPTGRTGTKSGWQHTALNSLFYAPDAERSTLAARSSSLALPSAGASASSAPHSAFHARPTAHAPPAIARENIRLPLAGAGASAGIGASTSAGGESPRSSVLDAAIDGRARASSFAPASSSASASGSASASTSASAPRVPGGARGGVAGYAFVSPLPSPRPGDLGAARMAQLMTWGAVARTPVVLRGAAAGASGGGSGGEDSSAPGRESREGASAREERVEMEGAGTGTPRAFALPPTPRRDELARSLASRALPGAHSSAHAASPYTTSTTARSAKRRSSAGTAAAAAAALSPAAQRLLARTARTPVSARTPSALGARLLGAGGGGAPRGARAEREGGYGEGGDTLARLKRRRWSPSPSPSPVVSRDGR